MNVRLREKTGSISIVMVVLVSVLLPLLLFGFAEINHYWLLKNKFKAYNDNIAQSAIMNLNEAKLEEGILEIVEDEAVAYAERMLITSYNLNDDFTPKGNYLLKKKPVMSIYIVNEVTVGGMEFTTNEGHTLTISNPSVIVYTECQPSGIFFNKFINIKSLSVYEVGFKETALATLTPSESPLQPVSFYIENVVNPYRFNISYPFRGLRWQFPSIPMVAGGEVTMSANVNDMIVNVQSVVATINITGVTQQGLPYNNQQILNLQSLNDVTGEGLTLRAHPAPDSETATWVINNSYDKDVIINWLQDNDEFGTIIATANSDTYFEAYARKQKVAIRVSVNGMVINNGIMTYPTRVNPVRTYVPVNNNNGAGLILENRYFGSFVIPDEVPPNATVFARIDVTGVDIDKNNKQILHSFPTKEEKLQSHAIGHVEDNINRLARFKKVY